MREPFFEVAFGLRHGIPEVIFVDDVITVEDTPGRMPADSHRNTFRNACPDHVPDRRPTQIVNSFPGTPAFRHAVPQAFLKSPI